MFAQEGLECIDFGMTGSQHYCATVRAPNGSTRKFFMSNTPSDGRGELNRRSEVRRFARQNA